VWTGLSLSTMATIGLLHIVADLGDHLSPNSATVTVFGDSVDMALLVLSRLSSLFDAGRAKKIIPYAKFDISGIVADFFAKFTAFIEEDSSHICCEFHYKN